MHARIRAWRNPSQDFSSKICLTEMYFICRAGRNNSWHAPRWMWRGPDIFLLDEPSANLDYEATQQAPEGDTNLAESGKTILIADHRIA